MNERYLWDGGGEADPEIQELERALSGFRYQRRPLDALLQNRAEPLGTRSRWWIGIAAAVLLAMVSVLGLRIHDALTFVDSGWRISWNGSRARAIRAGQTIDTGRHSVARLDSKFTGEVRVEPGSRLRVMRAMQDEQRLALERGTIHAFIWAPPGQFVVDTPSARTIDLGCRYTLRVAQDGSGLLRVETGWVAFQWRKLESFIPAGAECTTRPGQGPGTPHYDDCSDALKAALAEFDGSQSAVSLRAALRAARPRDALTVWHLLMRTQGSDREQVFARLGELVRLPPTVTEERILRGDPSAIDESWNALGLGNTDWWREWKRRW